MKVRSADNIKKALYYLRMARDILRRERCTKAVVKTRLAIKSTDGAIRNAYCEPYRQLRKDKAHT